MSTAPTAGERAPATADEGAEQVLVGRIVAASELAVLGEFRPRLLELFRADQCGNRRDGQPGLQPGLRRGHSR